MNRTIGTPEGTRDRLFSECAACRQVQRAADRTVSAPGLF